MLSLMAIQTEIQKAKRNGVKRALNVLTKHPDVVGVTAGYRLRKGRKTREECLTVFVLKKKPKSRVSKKRRIPHYLCGRNRDGTVNRMARVYTDIVQIGKARPLQSKLAGGGRIFVQGNSGTTTFTFEALSSSTQTFLLSNRHVLAPKKNPNPQQKIRIRYRLQGNLVLVGKLSHYFPFRSEVAYTGIEFRDAALGLLNVTGQHHARNLTISKLTGNVWRIKAIRPPRQNRLYWLRGASSGLQNGTLWDRLPNGGSWNVDYGPQFGALTVNRVFGLEARSRKGDSGAPIFEKTDGDATLAGIALAFATDSQTGRTITLFHSILDVEKSFAKLLGQNQFRFLPQVGMTPLPPN